MSQAWRCVSVKDMRRLDAQTGEFLHSEQSSSMKTKTPLRSIFHECDMSLAFDKYFNVSASSSSSSSWASIIASTAADDDHLLISVMGYSMRTEEFRYTSWMLFDPMALQPVWERQAAPLFEELYDHRDERLEDFTHRETRNVAGDSSFTSHLLSMRRRMSQFLRYHVVYAGRHAVAR